MRTPSSVRPLFIGSAGLLLCATAACGAMDSGTSESMGATSAAGGAQTSKPASTPMSSEPMMHGTEIIGGDSTFGTVLFDSTGQAVYIFDVETTSTPACYDECAEAWPPVLTEGAPAAGAGAQPELLGTTSRTDGATQVTYAGHPLYYYAHEGKHEVKCHDIALNGGTWFAVQLDG
ncbi:MAG TPA: hypothetical protein VJN29_08985, partial [Intrasporangium sp.]|uniref:COG4315 family predicted lipoprotein n=1 Tax=Intrasporangium sp. TaxID=1925024 RepID=UPI002B489749